MYHGTYVRLRRLAPDDAASILPFWNNYELRQYLPSPLPSTHNDLLSMIESANDAFAQRTKFLFGIETLETGMLIGIISLSNISWISRNAEIGMFAIFNTEQTGKGHGADALVTALDTAFSVLDLHSVYLWVETFNERAIKLYRKTGFHDCGTLRELAFRNGERCDILVMDLLKREFVEKHGILPKGNDI